MATPPRTANARSLLISLRSLAPGGAMVFVNDAAIQCENQGEGQFCHGYGVLAGTIGNQNAAMRSRRNVDGVDARTGSNHEEHRSA